MLHYIQQSVYECVNNIFNFVHMFAFRYMQISRLLTIFDIMQLFKMEDVSMGMWVEQFNSSREVEYVHSFKFCQFGCIEDYYTAHYQSPRQMTCMWDKLLHQGKPLCCNMR